MPDTRAKKSDPLSDSAQKGSGRELATLGVEQQTALELLLTGKSIAETARSAGVSRVAIYRWLKHDAAFQAAYNQWHDQLQESCRSRLQALTDKATDALEKALEAGDARAALQLLKGMGMIKERMPGPTDPEEVGKILAMDEKRRELKLRRERARLREDELTVDAGI
jgi:AcrR family transcriptional regulator